MKRYIARVEDGRDYDVIIDENGVDEYREKMEKMFGAVKLTENGDCNDYENGVRFIDIDFEDEMEMKATDILAIEFLGEIINIYDGEVFSQTDRIEAV